jgi:arsenate reductase
MDPKIEVLYFSGCPHATEALKLAQETANRLCPRLAVFPVPVETAEEARAREFPGSPSIRIDGIDVEPRGGIPGGMACRIYEGGAGVPPVWRIEASLLRALRPRHILFLCVANSARSQMAEGIARSLAPEGVRVSSAGSAPSGVRPQTVQAMKEIGIDISRHRSKGLDSIDTSTVDAVFTLCAEEVCPCFPGKVLRIHWGLPDPAASTGDDNAVLDAFRRVRDELERRLHLLFADPRE